MRDVIIVMAILTPLTICASAAFYLAAHGMDGWGWFLTVAALSSFISYRTGGKAND